MIRKIYIYILLLSSSIEVSLSYDKKVSIVEKEKINEDIKINIKTIPDSKFGKSMNLNINQMLNKSKKNKSIEMTTEISIEEVTMVDIISGEFGSSSGYDNVTDYFTVNGTDATETSSLEPVETTTITEIKKPKKTKKVAVPKMIPKSVCSCDLTKSLCDVNCCCDQECSESHRSVFSECSDEIANSAPPTTMLLQHCHTKDTFYYKNNSPWLLYQEHTPSSHLFCVIKDNLPPRLINKEPKVMTTVEELYKVSEGHYQWPHGEPQEEDMFDVSKPYTYNDNVWVIISSKLKLLEFPTSTLNTRCNKMVKMKYLVDYRAGCSVLPGDSNFIFTLYSGIDDVYVVSSPHAFNVTWAANLQDCPQNACIPITSYICDDDSCLLLNETEDATSRQLFTSVKLYLFSNGTTGYTNASIFFGVTDTNSRNQTLEQEFQIYQSFIRRNNSDLTQELSGNPGYQNGKPIITSRMVEGKDNETESNTLDFFSPSNVYPLRNIFAYPTNKRGNCVMSNLTHSEFRFRENLHFTCKIIHDISNLIKEENATKICIKLQQDLYKLMPYNLLRGKMYIAKMGNPSMNLYDWIELLHDSSNEIIKGAFHNDDRSAISCSNIVFKFQYTFVYASEEQPNIAKQLYLVGASQRYISDDNIVFNVVNNTVKSTLVIRSRFLDVTKPQPLRYARGPHFHIHLPSDFFYPFAFSGGISLKHNQVVNIMIHIYFTVFLFL